MIKEINFGTAIKLGKTLALSYHHGKGDRWNVTIEGDVFKFEDKQGEFNTSYTTKANVKYWIEGPAEDLDKKASKKKKDLE